MSKTHIIGAGLAGLSAAVRLAQAGRDVALYEGAGHAGGRCRSYYDATLDREIDNGNHLLMSANQAAIDYCKVIGSAETLVGPREAVFRFIDLATGQTWSVRPNRGLIPWWVLVPSRRIPNTTLFNYLPAAKIALANATQTVEEFTSAGDPLFKTFWEPFTVAVLNTSPKQGSANLMWSVLIRTFAQGATKCRPLIADKGLGKSLVDPALAFLKERGIEPVFNTRLREIKFSGDRVQSLSFGDTKAELGPGDKIILAVPPANAKSLLPDISAPDAYSAIVNGHIKLPKPINPPDDQRILGLIGGTVDWIFLRDDIASLTVSAADEIVDLPSEEIAKRFWADTSKALGLNPETQPPIRIIKEKRATFAQTPAQVARRPDTSTKWNNLFLAGDWTDTGLPATIEGAILSGEKAARLAA